MEYLLLFFGILLISTVIGILTGISSSPVVAIGIPLIFSLITAGWGAYSIFKQGQRKKIALLGGQLAVFAIGFVAGLWIGIYSKFNTDALGLAGSKVRPAYQLIGYSDPRQLMAFINLDAQMVASGVDFTRRVEVFKELQESFQARRKVRSQFADLIKALNTQAESPEIKGTKALIEKIRDVLEPVRQNVSAIDAQKADEIFAVLNTLEQQSDISLATNLGDRLVELDKLSTAVTPDELLDGQELDAVTSLLAKAEGKKGLTWNDLMTPAVAWNREPKPEPNS